MLDIFVDPPRQEWRKLTERASAGNADIVASVEKIIDEVQNGGDDALRRITLRIDGVERKSFQLSVSEIDEACSKVPEHLKAAILAAKANIEKMHWAEKPESVEVEVSPGVVCTQRSVPLGSVGIYAPGGRAPLFSTVLMLAVPAKVAGCEDIELCTPPGPDGKPAAAIVYAAHICGVNRIYALGGAQAIAAMAIGTESVKKADKIFGPGNRYVTCAKQLVGLKYAAIDMPAGPSEVMVIADATADPRCVAADLVAQAEHGPDSQSMAITDTVGFAEQIREATIELAEMLPRKEIILQSLTQSRIIVMSDKKEVIAFANAYAPEHLIISTRDAESLEPMVTAAGSVFVGYYTPESAGDYASGTNHTLPTNGWARSYSGVNTESFMRKMTVQRITREGIKSLAPVIIAMAEAEGLQGHAEAVRVRL